jgi:hypothetical protein
VDAPRYRCDQLMRFGWKVLLPLAPHHRRVLCWRRDDPLLCVRRGSLAASLL